MLGHDSSYRTGTVISRSFRQPEPTFPDVEYNINVLTKEFVIIKELIKPTSYQKKIKKKGLRPSQIMTGSEELN